MEDNCCKINLTEANYEITRCNACNLSPLLACKAICCYILCIMVKYDSLAIYLVGLTPKHWHNSLNFLHFLSKDVCKGVTVCDLRFPQLGSHCGITTYIAYMLKTATN